MKTWVDALRRIQVSGIDDSSLRGGILCPACCRIHGRSADAVLPLLYIADRTGDAEYLDAALRLQAWAENVRFTDGSWNNEASSYVWKFTTVFSVIALGLALSFFEHLLSSEIVERWTDRLRDAAEFLYENLTIDTGTINYPISGAAALAVANSIVRQRRYVDRAAELMSQCLDRFTRPNWLLFGEGHSWDCHHQGNDQAVDVAYNVEESLPNMVLYAIYAADSAVLDRAVRSLDHHLPFLLPDGAWDNSWGSRNFKWSYWGSRTTDGSLTLFTTLAEYSSAYRTARDVVLSAYERHTHDGLLLGGPHYAHAGQRVCAHHTFCHAKGLAQALLLPRFERNELPAPRDALLNIHEADNALVEFPEVHTWIVKAGPWRATVTAFDTLYVPDSHPSGGALSLLWHHSVGPIFAAGVNRFSLVKEADNLQIGWSKQNHCVTPRIEAAADGVLLSNLNDLAATVVTQAIPGGHRIESSGVLAAECDHGSEGPSLPCSVVYEITPETVEFTVSGAAEYADRSVRLLLPVITTFNEVAAEDGGKTLRIPVGNGDQAIHIRSSTAMQSSQQTFNHVPGFLAQELAFAVTEHGVRLVIGVES